MGDSSKISQSALIGEFLSVTRNPNNEVSSGFNCTQDEIEALS